MQFSPFKLQSHLFPAACLHLHCWFSGWLKSAYEILSWKNMVSFCFCFFKLWFVAQIKILKAEDVTWGSMWNWWWSVFWRGNLFSSLSVLARSNITSVILCKLILPVTTVVTVLAQMTWSTLCTGISLMLLVGTLIGTWWQGRPWEATSRQH